MLISSKVGVVSSFPTPTYTEKKRGNVDFPTVKVKAYDYLLDILKDTPSRGQVLSDAYVESSAVAGLNAHCKNYWDAWHKWKSCQSPDVYNTDYYVSEAFACWYNFSRKHVLRTRFPWMMEVADGKKIADLGCGLGFSTGMLACIHPYSIVYGTNITGTKQWQVCLRVAKDYGFTMKDTYTGADIVFAMDYFEHFEHPIDHLHDLLCVREPKVFVLANSFPYGEIGHFDYYLVGDQRIHRADMSKLFKENLLECGYKEIETGFDDHRPEIWVYQEGEKQ